MASAYETDADEVPHIPRQTQGPSAFEGLRQREAVQPVAPRNVGRNTFPSISLPCHVRYAATGSPTM